MKFVGQGVQKLELEQDADRQTDTDRTHYHAVFMGGNKKLS